MSHRRASFNLHALLVSAVGLALAASITGCGAAPGPVYDAFLQSASTACNNTFVPRYETYVQNDPKLSLETKTSYLDEAAAFRSVTEAAVRERAGP